MTTERPKRTGVQLCYPFEEKRLNKWLPPFFVQPKLDGERCRIIVRQNGALLLSSTEEIITSVPHINAAAKKQLPEGEYDGELYLHGKTFEEIHSIVSRRVNLHENFELMEFHLFDIMTPAPFMERLTEVLSLNVSSPIVLVETIMAHDLESILQAKNHYTSLSYEGIIIRHSDYPYERKRSTGVMKWKPKQRDAYLIVDSFEEIDKNGVPKNRLGGFVCRGDDGTEFRVGSGFTAEQRKTFWQIRYQLDGRFLMVEYQHLTPGRGCPRFPIFCHVVNEQEAQTVERRTLY